MRLSNLVVAVISLFASGTLLAQSAPPKQPKNSGGTPVAQAPAGGASKGVPAESEGDKSDKMSTGTKAAIGIGIAAGIAAASGGGSSTTTHH
jgi:hypothetical protein